MNSMDKDLKSIDSISELPYGEAVDIFSPILARYLKEKLTQFNQILPIHLQEVTAGYLMKPGKYLRPALLLMTCEAAGTPPSQAFPAAAAMEMFHNWTLLHDDIIDHDSFRRGCPTGHVRGAELGKKAWQLNDKSSADYGQSLAILAGDVLQGQVVHLFTMLQNLEPRVVISLIERLTGKLYNELLAGEQMDIDLSYRSIPEIQSEEIMEMMRLKTGALLRFCAEAGYAIGRNLPVEENYTAQQLGLFAEACGLAFQLQDDILGITGEEKKFGKPIGSDLREGKRTLLLLETWKAADKNEKILIEQNIGNPEAPQEKLMQVKDLMIKYNVIGQIRQLAEDNVALATKTLHASIPDDFIRQQLDTWAELMTQRIK